MQKILSFIGLFVAFLSLPSMGAAEPPVRWEPTLDSAQRLASQTGRPVLIYFTAPWCAVCKRMEAEVLTQPSVAGEITADYVPVKVDPDHFPATARQYGVTALPTTVITTPQGQVLVAMQGRVEAADYVTRLSQIAAGAKQHGGVTAQIPTNSTPPAMAAPAAPPTTTAPRALAQMPPGGAPPMAGPPILAPNSPTLTGTTQPGGANNQSARTTTGLSDDRYADIFRGGQAAPATPIAQPPSSLAGPPNLQPPPNFASLPPGAVPPANMPANMPTSTPAMARGLTQGYPPSQPPPAATSPMGQSPALAAAAPSYGSQAPLMSAQPMNGSPPGNPTAPPAAGPAPQLPTINPPLGMDGYCPVSLSESQRWLVGDRRWGAIHRGRTYLFVGPEEQRRFFADPDRYAPAASGNDVVLATEQGQAVPGMRQHGVYFSNRVYLFANEATLEKFSKNPNVYVNQALGSLRAGTYSGQQMR